MAAPTRAPAGKLVTLAGALALYLLVLEAIGRLAGPIAVYGRLIVPNLILLAAGLLVGRHGERYPLFEAGPAHRRPLVALLVAAGLSIPVAAFYLTARPGSGGSVGEHLGLVLLPPLAEEVYFRATLLPLLARDLGRLAATLLTSALFGGLHATQGRALLMSLLSLPLCLAALASGSVLWPLAYHLAWNALGALLLEPGEGGRLLIAGAALVGLLVLGLLALREPRRGTGGPAWRR